MASDFGTSLSANLVSKLVEYAVRETRYLFKFKRYFEEFKSEKEKLKLAIQSVVDRVENAKKNAERIDNDVKRWLNEADLLIERVVELEGKAEEKKNIIFCHGRQFPNLIKRYQLAKLLDKMKHMIKDLNNPKFSQFSHPNLIVGMEYYSSKDFDYFKNTKLAYEKLLEVLKDDNISCIGLYAMGGSGKTSLVKQVGKEVEKLFDKVVFVLVSTEVNLRKIQGKIAGQINCELKEEEVPERARRLNMRLTTGEKILIILDDVWQILNFEAIGIPFGNNQMGCKILLTTRREDLCVSMDCKPIPLGLLTEEEALTLFKKHAHITADTSELEEKEHLAKEITQECKGLLIAIKSLAVILKGKALVQWEHALKALKEFRAADNIPWGEENPYKCLEVSFKMLRVEVQEFLMLCSVFGDDEEMPVELLIRFAFGLDMFENVNSYKDARMEVGAAIKELVHSSLLFENEKQCVTMHDLVRDVAIWLANKEKKIVVGPEMDLAALAERATTKDAKFLCCDCKREFPNKLDCPKLQLLKMQYDNKDPFELPGTILKGKKELKVLFIISAFKGSWESQSTNLLKNLRCLDLWEFTFNDMSFMEKLKTLTTLVLADCEIIELPNGLSELHKLRLLDVCSCQIGGNPYPVLAKCPQLEELYFFENDFLERDAVLENLADIYQKNNSFSLLQRYRLQIGPSICIYSNDNDESRKFDGNLLTICPFDAHMITNAAFKIMFQTTDKVCLKDIKGCKCIVPDIFQANECLRELELEDSTEIDCILDTTNDYLQRATTSFPKMGELRVSYMSCMKTLCCGPLPHGLFEKLKLLNLVGCPMLKYLFSPALAQNLVLLEQLQIYKCEKLKRVVGDEEEQEEIRNADHKSLFPKLKLLFVKECKNLECLFHIQDFHGPSQLEKLQIEDVPKLKYVIGKCCHEDQFLYRNQNQIGYQSIEFPLLKELILYNLQSIISICQENYRVMWPSLQKFYVQVCPELSIASINNCTISSEMIQDNQDETITEELSPLVIQNSQMVNNLQIVQNMKRLTASHCKIQGIFQLAGGPNGLDVDPLTSSISYLGLVELPELRYICKGPKQCMSFPHLREMCISKCRKLRCLLSPCILEGLPKLEVLVIWSCDQLQQIIEVDLELQNYLSPPMKSNEANVSSKIASTSSAPLEASPHPHQNSGSFNLCSLRQLTIISCPMLMSLFEPSTAKTLTSLEYLKINDCDHLEQIVEENGENQDSSSLVSQQLCFPKLATIKIKQCNKLTNIFSLNEVPQLQNLTIKKCSLLEKVFVCEAKNDDIGQAIRFEMLDYLRLYELPNLIHVCQKIEFQTGHPTKESNLSNHQPQRVSLPNLAAIEVQHCHKLIYLFSIGSPLELPHLQELAIENCSSLEKVFVDEDSEADSGQAIMLPMLNHLRLLGLPELIYVCQGFKLHSPKLNFVSIDPLLNSVLGPVTPLQKASLHEIEDEDSSNEKFQTEQQSINGSIEDVLVSKATKIAIASKDLEPNSPLPVMLVTTSQSINGSVKEHSTLVKTEVAASSANSKPVSPLIVTSLHETYSKSIIKGTVEEIVPVSPGSAKSLMATSSSEPSPSTLHSIKESVEVGPILEKVEIASSSIPSETFNSKQEPLVTSLHETSQKSIKGSVNEVPTSEATNTATTSNDLGLESSLLIVNGSVEELSISVKAKMAASSSNSEQSIKESVEVGSISEKAEIASSSIHSKTCNLKQEQLVPSLHIETSPKEFIVNELTIQSIAVQEAVVKIEKKFTQKDDKPFGLAHMGPSNEKKTYGTSTLISSITEMNAAGSSSSSANLILQPELLQELKTELDAYLNMSLEAIRESNALDNVEGIVNSLAMGTSDVIQRNILEDFKTRLVNFKECVPQAMNTRQSSFEFISNYENLNMELNAKLIEGQGKVKELESKLFETCEEEHAIETEIQQLINRKIEIVARKNSLAQQLDQSTREVLKDHEKWKALGEELKLSTSQWLKAKEVLAHANASWSVFKESLRF